jgi:hypothetical protein
MNDTQLYYIPSSDSIGWSGGGTITLTVPMSLLKSAYRRIRGGISGEGESIEGFFDFAKKALDSVGKVVSAVAKSPLIKAVAGVIPYGSTAMEIIGKADKALSAARAAINKKPSVHKAIHKATSGDKAAARALKALPLPAKKAAARAVVLQKEALNLAKGLTMAKRALEQAGYTPALQRALRMPPAPWR